MRGLLFLLVVVVAVAGDWSYTDEYLLTGKGTELMQMISNTTHNFCYLSNGQSFYSSKEVCNITTSGDSYYVEKNSDEKDFSCGSRCVENYGGEVSEPVYLSGEGSEQKTMMKYGSSFCYLILGQDWNSEKEACFVTHDDKYWYLHKDSSSKTMSCGGQCGYDNGLFSDEKLTDEVVLSGQGNQWRSLEAPIKNSFCFLTRGREWHHVDEHCQVEPGVEEWELSCSSKQDGFECGARCVTM